MTNRLHLLDRALAERSLAEFVRQAWGVLEPKPFQDNWHIDLLIEYLEAIADGDITRLIINVPPRSGKSLLATIFLPCWVWLHNPAERFMFASYSSILSTKHSVDRRTLIQSPMVSEPLGQYRQAGGRFEPEDRVRQYPAGPYDRH